MDPDGGRQALLTNGAYDYYPLVAADSRSIFFVRQDQPQYPLYVIPTDGGAATLLSGPSSEVSATQWQAVPAGFRPDELSPDGSLILGSYSDGQGGRRLAVVRADGKGTVRTPDIRLQLGETIRSYAWAPDGRAITVVRTVDGASNLWRCPLDGAPAVRLAVYPPGDDVSLHAWSREGKYLALVRTSYDRQVVMMRETVGDR